MIKEYYRANDIEEAYEYQNKGAEILAGGGFVSKHQDGIDSVVDIQKIGLTGIEVDDQFIKIGAAEKLQTIIEHKEIPGTLKEAILRFPGSLNVRNAATLAGAVLVSDGRFDILPWLLVAGTEVEIFPEMQQTSLSNYLQSYKTKKVRGIITKLIIPVGSAVKTEVISRTPNDAILVGLFINEPLNSERLYVCVSGQDLYPISFSLEKNAINKRQIFINNINNAHSHYSNKFVSFSYFLSTATELFERMVGE